MFGGSGGAAYRSQSSSSSSNVAAVTAKAVAPLGQQPEPYQQQQSFNRGRNLLDQQPQQFSNISNVRVVPTASPRQQAVSDLVVQSLNFHGQQLTSFMKETNSCKNIDVKRVDYHLYQQRSRELKLEDRGKRLLLHRFIAQKSDSLFVPGMGKASRVTLENDHTEDHMALLPPMELFAQIPPEDRAKQFFAGVSVGDIVYCRIQRRAATGLIVLAIVLDPLTGKSRHIEDAMIKGFCPTSELSEDNEISCSFQPEDLIRVVIVELKPDMERFLGSMRNQSLPVDLQNITKLGLVTESDLPVTLRYGKQALERGFLYEDFLEKSTGFINPNNVAHLCSELGLDDKTSSLMHDLDGKYPPSHYAPLIRKAQNTKWANKHVHLGIKHFKANNKIEAFQCLNQALNIDAENVEGLVARGALYANNNGLEKALLDFEAALKINPGHQNGKKYMCETLIAVARNFEDDKNLAMALDTYERIVRIVPNHKEANDSILFLSGRSNNIPPETSLPSLRPSAEDDLREEEVFTNTGGGGDRHSVGDGGDSKDSKRRSDTAVVGSGKKEKKKKRRRASTSDSSISSSSSSPDHAKSSKRNKKKRRRGKKGSPDNSRSPSVASVSPRRKRPSDGGPGQASSVSEQTPAAAPRRAVSPFSAKLTEPHMNMPADYSQTVQVVPLTSQPSAYRALPIATVAPSASDVCDLNDGWLLCALCRVHYTTTLPHYCNSNNYYYKPTTTTNGY